MATWTTLAPEATPALPETRSDGAAGLVDHLLKVGASAPRTRREASRQHRGPGVRSLLAAVDVLVALTTVAVVSWVAADGHIAPWSAAALIGGWLACLGGNRAWSAGGHVPAVRPVARAGATLGLACWAGGALVDLPLSSRQLLAVTATLTFASLLPRASLVLRGRRAVPLRIAVAGGVDDGHRLLAELDRATGPRWAVTAACWSIDPAGTGFAEADAPPFWLGPERVVEAALATDASAVLLVPGPDLDPASIRRLCWQARSEGLDAYVATGLLDVVPARATVVNAGTLGIVHVQPGDRHVELRMLKELTERMVAVAALVVTLPVLAAVALAVRLDSPGPTLFRQTRVGRDGRTFTMFKFRTMVSDAEQLRHELLDRNDCDGVLFKMQRDPRITRVGERLRRYSLDELPQLLNVVRGEMSLVGPRPALPSEIERYDVDPRHRLAVKPGITGLWQVSGRSDLSWEETVRLDLHYVDNWSLGLDLAIVLRTFGAVLSHRGAY